MRVVDEASKRGVEVEHNLAEVGRVRLFEPQVGDHGLGRREVDALQIYGLRVEG
jgi:hypothetical protein